ncbi:hypothetical protein BN140_3066 [Methanoculleus bourgensis MS2]|uniref:Uncharacterized protein n=2 Tax=Methanoculleus bourgensis TaxID=83986 RepID=W6PQK5_METBM|nr:hypothetical protein BN140_3066 [Methanoculleus bourgensis MS2]CVK34492.1 protein of unknown function [Methanoculleus bourgensis]
MVRESDRCNTFPLSLLQWSHVFSDMVRAEVERDPATSHVWLQWSHVFSDMVRPQLYIYQKYISTASMEPCLFRHGKLHHKVDIFDVILDASMEPCLFRHGKLMLIH